MKKQLFIFLWAMYSLSSFAQDKAMLTKDETIHYLSKKLNETIGYQYNKQYIIYNKISMNECEVLYSKKHANKLDYSPSYRTEDYNNYRTGEFTNTIKLNYIKDIIDLGGVANENCGRIKIILTSNSSKKKEIQNAYILKTEQVKIQHNYNEQQQTGKYWHLESRNYYIFEAESNTSNVVTEIYLYYLKSDPTNFNKIKKALEHLRDLCKAEDDPFGE